MYQSHLYAIKTALIIFPIVAFVFLLPYVIYQYYRYGSVSFFRSFVIYAFIFYLMNVVFLVMLPLLARDYVANMTSPVSDFRLFGFVADLNAQGLFKIESMNDIILLVSNDRFMEPVLNLMLFIPLGVFLRYYFKRSIGEVFLVAFFFSFTIELTQLSGIFGYYDRPHRLFQLDDLFLNSMGGLVGYWLTPIFVYLFPTREEIDEKTYAQRNTVSIARKAVALLIDWLLILLLGFVLVKMTYGSLKLSLFMQRPLYYIKRVLTNESVYIISMLAVFVFFVLIPYLTKGRTIGMAMVKIKLKNLKKSTLTLGSLFARTILFYGYINIFYWSVYKIIEYRDLNVDMGTAGRAIPVFLLLLVILVIVDFLYSLYRAIPMMYERLSNTIHVSVHGRT